MFLIQVQVINVSCFFPPCILLYLTVNKIPFELYIKVFILHIFSSFSTQPLTLQYAYSVG